MAAGSNISSLWFDALHVSHTCKAGAFLIIFASTASFFWTTCLAIHLYLIIMNKGDLISETAKMLLFHAVSWGLPLLFSVVALSCNALGHAPDLSETETYIKLTTGGWCWIKTYKDKKKTIAWTMMTSKIWELVSYLLITILCLLILRQIHLKVNICMFHFNFLSLIFILNSFFLSLFFCLPPSVSLLLSLFFCLSSSVSLLLSLFFCLSSSVSLLLSFSFCLPSSVSLLLSLFFCLSSVSLLLSLFFCLSFSVSLLLYLFFCLSSSVSLLLSLFFCLPSSVSLILSLFFCLSPSVSLLLSLSFCLSPSVSLLLSLPLFPFHSVSLLLSLFFCLFSLSL